jgi:hypothetical protein
MNSPWTLLAILSAMPGAYLSFRRSLIRDLKDQMQDADNPSGVGVRTVSVTYKLLACIFLGIRNKNELTELFNPSSELNQKKAKIGKNDALWIFAWFIGTFLFSLIAWWNR